MPRCNGFCSWIKRHGQSDRTAYTYAYLALIHAHTHTHTYMHTHTHAHIIIDTHTLHFRLGFRACPNGRVHHDPAHSYDHLGSGLVSISFIDGAGVLPIHIFIHIHTSRHKWHTYSTHFHGFRACLSGHVHRHTVHSFV